MSADIPGQSITAHYFVENGVIHANIAGRTLLSPVGNCSPRNTVKALLTSYMLQRSRRNVGRNAQLV
jgi:hypothetical protein